MTLAVKRFVREMNRVCEKLGLKNTRMSNPHGLIKLGNISTAEEVAIITAHCLKNPFFRSVVRKQSFFCHVRKPDGSLKLFEWKNSNQLLDTQDSESFCIGVKTGFTPGAGSCLSALFRVGELELIVIFMGGDKNSEYDS